MFKRSWHSFPGQAFHALTCPVPLFPWLQFAFAYDEVSRSNNALCVKPLRNLAFQGFAKTIPSAPIFPLSLSNSLSFASIPIVKIGKNYENFNFQTLNPFSQWRAALTNFSFSRYFLKKSSFFSTKNFKFVGPALLFFGQKYPIYWYFSGGKIFVGKYLQFVNFWKRIVMFSSENERTLIFYF